MNVLEDGVNELIGMLFVDGKYINDVDPVNVILFRRRYQDVLHRAVQENPGVDIGFYRDILWNAELYHRHNKVGLAKLYLDEALRKSRDDIVH